MNQILSTNNQSNEKKHEEKNYSKPTGKTDTKKVIIVFAIIILIFGAAFAGFGLYKSSQKSKKEQYNGPEITMEQTEVGVAIKVSSEVGIQQVSYYWETQEDENIENLNNSSLYNKIVKPINGTNTLHVEVIDSQGKKFEKQASFEYELDIEKPLLEFTVTENENSKKVMKIKVTDETELDYAKYSWNGGEETVVSAEEGEKELELNVEVLDGENKLIIIATDKSGNETKEEKTVKGFKNPEVNVKVSGDVMIMTVTHEVGIKKIEYNINGTAYVYDENYSGYDATKTKVEFTYKYKEGKNTVLINATSIEDTIFEYTGEYMQNAQ